jgi:hypothetical protein
MKANENMEHNIKEALNSLDGMEKASAGPYFFTRLQQRLQAAKISTWEKIGGWISKPTIAFGSLFAVIILNAALIINKPAKPDRFDESTDDYSMASSSSNIYEIPETE